MKSEPLGAGGRGRLSGHGWSGPRLADPIGEKDHDLSERKIADGGENTKDNRGEDDHDGRVTQFYAGGPGSFLKLSDHFAEEDAGAAERIFHERNMAGAEGIEPPTNGFGDRYSTN